ncbi:hypothetical protein INT46_000491 [Mucor plumbeus]|uniref:EF-hand domain-containing protein n=1 Tax=Mucor plumbeus TaxID=97098 RepID=A0A8H7R1N3_9FUNG|nr:hypothetical protein INT46_000491 [Mucor plumbeus]
MDRRCNNVRKPNSQKKKLDEKIKAHFNVFRVNMSKKSMHDGSGDNIHTLNDLNCQPMDMHIPGQQTNHHQQQHHQQQPNFSSCSNNDDILAWAQELPPAAFVDLIDTSNLDMALGQISPSFYLPLNIPIQNSMQQPHTNNDHTMDFTNIFNNNSMPQHCSHHSYPSIVTYEHNDNNNSNDATFNSLSSSSTNTTNPFDNSNIMTNNQNGFSQQNHAHCNGMPSRPNPPMFKNGPSYLRASEDFILFFHAIDADDSGLITFDELKQYLRNKDRNNTSFNNEAVMTLIEMFDNNEDNSGTIDYQEMHYAIQSLGFADLSHKLILHLLQKFDHSGSGLIDFDNFILACVTLCRCKEIYEVMCIKFGSTSLPINLEQFIISFIWPTPL